MKIAISDSLVLFVVILSGFLAVYSVASELDIQKKYFPDEYEIDNTPADAVQFNLSAISPQIHNFHKQGDEDWIKFHALQNDIIEIKTFDPGGNCETEITLFDRDGITEITKSYFVLSSGENLISWNSKEEGIYYVRIAQNDSTRYGAGTIYSLWIYRLALSMSLGTGYIEGLVTNAESGNPVSGAVVQTDLTSGLSRFKSHGYYTLECPAGDVTLTATKTGYETFSTVVTAGEASRVELHIALTPSYAYNSSYELIQWVKRGSDTYYCIDICDLAGNAYQGLENIACGDDMNAWSPKDFININLGIPDSALSGFRFMWKIRSLSGYGGQGFEGLVSVP